MTASQFAARIVGFDKYPPPIAATGDRCWLCGGFTNGVGWRREDWIKPTFTNHNEACCLDSDAICQACVAMSSKEPWEQYVAAHPEMGLKTGHAMSWRFYSHVFSHVGHRCPTKPEWRMLLVEPPEPPFLCVISTSGQKHLIFRARVSHSRDRYWLRFEDQLLYVDRRSIAQRIALVEQALAAGMVRVEIESGQYRPKLPAGVVSVAEWLTITSSLDEARIADPQLLTLACHVAHKQDVRRTDRTTGHKQQELFG